MPQLSAERKLVPIPKQITNADLGCPWKASGRCDMNFVMGVSRVMPRPFTSNAFLAPVPEESTEAA